MANEEHLKILKQGVAAWNEWRKEHHRTRADLREANLIRAILGYANLRDAELLGANLREADLSGANLSGANLSEAGLVDANLREAVLRDANLTSANLGRANLTMADLSDANLTSANLGAASCKHTNLTNAALSNARLISTAFMGVDLSRTRHLDSCLHAGRCFIDYWTLQQSGTLPFQFLRGCGLPDDLIKYLPSLLGQPIQFYSCFISYSHADKSFARRLHDGLQGRGIRCWLDEHQMLPGDDIYDQVDRGIKLWDKVLLCCSKASLNSPWVDREIDKGLQKEEQLWKEREQKALAIIPLNLDGHMFEWESGKASIVKSRLAADFTGWENDNEKFEEQFERVVKALTTGEAARGVPPEQKL